MIPLKDDAPRVSTPYVTWFLIAANTIVFLFELAISKGDSRQFNAFVTQFGVVPARFPIVLFNQGYVPWDLVYQMGTRYVPPVAAFLPVFTSMFLHGSWMHLIFNMLTLYIFGDNVEDYLGHFRYILLYLVSGVIAMAVHTLFNLNSTVPTVGASGAIAGVMGAYFLLYPRAKVLTIVPLFFMWFMWLPAWIVLGYFFVGQFLLGAATSISVHGGSAGGVAVWAHVGGFLAGMGLIKLFPTRARRYYYSRF
ncbi:MAG TPA: rhomboid family intramembrane serine protease [Candidatus Bathyarchaeia archaeon]|nr:rhomboid family intramembrane serine protease [Candidatus Bathyarchaeia archaeon]